MKVKFNKKTTNETDGGKLIKLTLAGSLNAVDYKLTMEGVEEDVLALMKELKLVKYGQMIDLDLANSQTTVEDFEK